MLNSNNIYFIMASFHSVGNSTFAFTPRQEKVPEEVKQWVGCVGYSFFVKKVIKKDEAMKRIFELVNSLKKSIIESSIILNYATGATHKKTDPRMNDIFKLSLHCIRLLLVNDYKNAIWFFGQAAQIIDEIASDFDSDLTTELFKTRLEAVAEIKEQVERFIQTFVYIYIFCERELGIEIIVADYKKHPMTKFLKKCFPSLSVIEGIETLKEQEIKCCPKFLKETFAKNETQRNDFLIHFTTSDAFREDIKKKKPSPPKKKEPITIENALDW